MRELWGRRRFPALLQLAALVLLLGPAASHDPAQLSSIDESATTSDVAGPRALVPGASQPGSAPALQANSHLLLHG